MEERRAQEGSPSAVVYEVPEEDPDGGGLKENGVVDIFNDYEDNSEGGLHCNVCLLWRLWGWVDRTSDEHFTLFQYINLSQFFGFGYKIKINDIVSCGWIIMGS